MSHVTPPERCIEAAETARQMAPMWLSRWREMRRQWWRLSEVQIEGVLAEARVHAQVAECEFGPGGRHALDED